MIVMKFTIELDIGPPFLLQFAAPLAGDRSSRRELIVVGRLSDRTATVGAAPRSRKRKPLRALSCIRAPFPAKPVPRVRNAR
jgi:hypothetical protein